MAIGDADMRLTVGRAVRSRDPSGAGCRQRRRRHRADRHRDALLRRSPEYGYEGGLIVTPRTIEGQRHEDRCAATARRWAATGSEGARSRARRRVPHARGSRRRESRDVTAGFRRALPLDRRRQRDSSRSRSCSTAPNGMAGTMLGRSVERLPLARARQFEPDGTFPHLPAEYRVLEVEPAFIMGEVKRTGPPTSESPGTADARSVLLHRRHRRVRAGRTFISRPRPPSRVLAKAPRRDHPLRLRARAPCRPRRPGRGTRSRAASATPSSSTHLQGTALPARFWPITTSATSTSVDTGIVPALSCSS